jgi:hypothetical protein
LDYSNDFISAEPIQASGTNESNPASTTAKWVVTQLLANGRVRGSYEISKRTLPFFPSFSREGNPKGGAN